MIVDTSALVAIFRSEPTASALRARLCAPGPHLMSSATFVELTAVLRAEKSVREVDALLAALDITVVALTVEQARLAAQAYRDYGRGSGSPARLNLGDTFSYALAKDTGRPLLCVGDDFPGTDVETVPLER